ncbi:Putative cell surface protein [Sodalis praecaptivus]|uniref:Putative cell surface protein n=1 Tax=Sodalis praecaptivus TaxID=1239307 RepID=W0HTB5_9GAMM|nr:hypothetical protein [Sodalis praecaptivus]AHF77004.1 Putative cell surface protein [Sodalis praecaptivus]
MYSIGQHPAGGRAKHLLAAAIGIICCCQPGLAMTIDASAVVEVPVPDLQLWAKGGYPTTDSHTGFTRMMLIPNGSNPGVGGYANVVVTTNQGSFSVRLPLCQDADQWACWDNPSYWVDVPAFDGQSVTGGDNPVITGFTVSGSLQNLTGKALSMMVKLQVSDNNGWGSSANGFSTIGHATLPAAPVCSVDVNPTATFGPLGTGQTAAPIQITSNSVGDGHITFTPDAHDDNGGLLQNDHGNTLSYGVVNSASSVADWQAAEARWRGDQSDDYAVELDKIPSTAQPGAYSGRLQVTLACD